MHYLSHLDYVFMTVVKDILKNKNVALESERDPEFRGGVEKGLRAVEYEIYRLQDAMSS